MESFYPKKKIVKLEILVYSEEELKYYLEILKNFESFYLVFNDEQEKKVYLLSCYLSKWNYFLLQPELDKKPVRIYVNETS